MFDLNLDELFSMADEIGDKYLTAEEIAARNAKLLEARTELWNSLSDADLDYLYEIDG